MVDAFRLGHDLMPDWFMDRVRDCVYVDTPKQDFVMNRVDLSQGPSRKNNKCIIKTLHGDMSANYGDWIIRGAKGAFDLCKSDIFEATYEAVESEDECTATR